MFLLHVLISTTLNKSDRFELLSLSIKLFYFYLSQIEECNEDDLFTPSFHNKTSIGTLFGTYDNIIRCINACVECHYGKVRMLSNYNHTFDNSLSATVNAKILYRICEELGYKVSIRTRANNAGVVLTNEILHGPCAPIDFSFLFDTLFFLFESVKMNRFQIKAFEYLINNHQIIHKLKLLLYVVERCHTIVM